MFFRCLLTKKFVSYYVSGLTLSITSHSHKGQAQEDELVLTNMAFTSGLHFWEVLATISCSNLCK